MACNSALGRRPLSLANRNPTLSGLSQVTGSLYISSGSAAKNKALLSTNQITCIIHASMDRASPYSTRVEYVHVPVADSPDFCLLNFFDLVADKIHSVETLGGRTLLHCVAGISRSATLCLAYLMKYNAMSLLVAHTWLKTCRPIVRPNSGFWTQLITYEFQLFGRNTVGMISSPIGEVPDIYESETRGMVPL
ncbi:dual specificity protein phosphatase 18 [Ambystoma mexicanum]|uniref:dual specificity protein phosphatase 18 n=1 Tax=Ambystoma mexicanum TaxID=8296 RepID=UPI0037E966E1